jgi:hypothetical protein|tara:strand:- start:1144 stop:1683 length:540 start_codon:yes stop_codon:yes gene_type:complete
MESAQKIGYGLVTLSVILMIIGSVGYTVEGDVEEVPTPNVPDVVFFADDPLPSNPAGLFFNADAHITWDRDDIFLVISDAATKKECGNTPAGLGGFGSGTSCNSGNINSVAGGANDNNVDGVIWDVESGKYYVGIGSKDQVAQGVEINVHYKVEVQFSFVSYLVCTLIAATGLAYAKFS